MIAQSKFAIDKESSPFALSYESAQIKLFSRLLGNRNGRMDKSIATPTNFSHRHSFDAESSYWNDFFLRSKMTWFWIWWQDIRYYIQYYIIYSFSWKIPATISWKLKKDISRKNRLIKKTAASEHISPHFAIFGFAIVLPIEHTVWVLLFYNISNRNRIEITCLMQNHIKTFRIKCRTTVNKQRPEKSM